MLFSFGHYQYSDSAGIQTFNSLHTNILCTTLIHAVLALSFSGAVWGCWENDFIHFHKYLNRLIVSAEEEEKGEEEEEAGEADLNYIR